MKLKKLYIDIETLPNIAVNWAAGSEVSIPYNFIIKEREILCIGYKWEGKRVQNLCRSKRVSEKDILKKFLKIASEADVIIGHNGDRFDIKWIKTRLLMLDLGPLPDIISIDTLKLARSNFLFNSNKLDYIAKALGIGHKVSTGGMDLWLKCMEMQPSALKTMVKYCNKDVELLEKIDKKLAPYVTNYPVNRGSRRAKNLNMCYNCDKRGTKHGRRITRSQAYQRYKCSSCGATWKGEALND